MTTNQPLRLATGSHKAGTGKGCAMNVISWENGDTTITDFPVCSDRMLTHIVQQVNDTICDHSDDDMLCPSCSLKVLELGHRTVGTAGLLPDDQTRVVWVRVACRLAREVAHLNPDPRVMAAIEAAEVWCDNPTAKTASAAAAADAAANAAAYTSAYAANAAANAAYAAAWAANAAANAAYAAANELRMAHLAIDTFNELTGHTDTPTDPTATADAIERMLATT